MEGIKRSFGPKIDSSEPSAEERAAVGAVGGHPAFRDAPPPGVPKVKTRAPEQEIDEEDESELVEEAGAPPDDDSPGNAAQDDDDDPKPKLNAAADDVPYPDFEEEDNWPAWAVLPKQVKPKPGTRMECFKFEAEHTEDQQEHWCIVWPLKDKEQANAYKNTAGTAERAIAELAKMGLRVVDGLPARWDVTPATSGSIMGFWNVIGAKGRQMLQEWYAKAHAFSKEERKVFFARCYGSKRA